MERLSEQEAIDFFSKLYGGRHHVPGFFVKKIGLGWFVKHDKIELATFDNNLLTKLVILAHDRCIRAEVCPITMGIIEVRIWKRIRTGNSMEGHPDLESHIKKIRDSLLQP